MATNNSINTDTNSFCKTANNLSDVTASTARTNLGLGSAAIKASSTFLQTVNVQVFTSSGTYTPTTGAKYAIVEVQGGGGGGGGDGTNVLNPGGGGGGYARKLVSAPTSQTITVGAAGAAHSNGGTSSFGVIVSATGGNGGATNGAIGGAGGAGSGGDININGSYGTIYIVPGTSGIPTATSGWGGNSVLGHGAPGVTTSPTAGVTATGYGAGGSGAWFGTGGSGSAGVVIVTEFIAT